MFNSINNNRGQVLVLVAVSLLVFIGFAALAIDIGYFYHAKNQLQGAADAGALAGVASLPTETAARAAAVNYASQNIAAGSAVQVSDNGSNVLSALSINPGNDITVGFWSTSTGTYSAGGTPTNAIQVRARRTVGSPGGGVVRFFGKIFRSDQQDVKATAIATKPARSSSFTSLCSAVCGTAIYPNVMSLEPPRVMDTKTSTPNNSQFAWTSLTTRVTSASGVSADICGDEPNMDSCGNYIYSTNGTAASVTRDLESAMYDPDYERSSKEFSGTTVTGWWVILPVTSTCPPGAQPDPQQVVSYAKIRIKAICISGTHGCKGNYEAPSSACSSYPNNVMVIDRITCISCSNQDQLLGFKPRLSN